MDHGVVVREKMTERYLLDEIIPSLPEAPVGAGTSFGALHAVLLALRHPTRMRGFIGLSGTYDTSKWLDGEHGGDLYFTNPLAFLPGLRDEAYLAPMRAMEKKVIATGDQDPNVAESVRVGKLLLDRGVDVALELHPGWQHDWPYWKEMMLRYV